jgi:pyruvate dehydrogenase E1 component beta subunit
VVCLEHEVLYGHSGEVPEGDDFTLPIGKAKVTKEGTQVTLIGYSMMAVKALQAAEELAKEGIDAEVLDLRSLRPLDVDSIVQSVSKTHRAVVLEETWAAAGVGAEVMATISDKCWDELDAPVLRLSQLPVPLPYASNLEVLCVPQVADIVREVKKLVG